MNEDEKTHDKIKHPTSNVISELRIVHERNVFSMKLIFRSVSYLLITLLLNYIRKDASLWIIWPIIIIQFSFYFSIFILCFNRIKVIGLNKYVAFFLMIALIFIGRIEDFENVLIPLLIIIMLMLSTRNKNLSPEFELYLLNRAEKIRKEANLESGNNKNDEIAKFLNDTYINPKSENTTKE